MSIKQHCLTPQFNLLIFHLTEQYTLIEQSSIGVVPAQWNKSSYATDRDTELRTLDITYLK